MTNGRQHAVLCKRGRRGNNQQWCRFQLQFRADGILFPRLHKAVPLCVMLHDHHADTNQLTKHEQTSQRFAKAKRAAKPPTNRYTIAAHLFLPQRTKDRPQSLHLTNFFL